MSDLAILLEIARKWDSENPKGLRRKIDNNLCKLAKEENEIKYKATLKKAIKSIQFLRKKIKEKIKKNPEIVLQNIDLIHDADYFLRDAERIYQIRKSYLPGEELEFCLPAPLSPNLTQKYA